MNPDLDRSLGRLESAVALIWQERQERIYAARILQGIYQGKLDGHGPALMTWSTRVLKAHDLVNEDDL